MSGKGQEGAHGVAARAHSSATCRQVAHPEVREGGSQEKAAHGSPPRLRGGDGGGPSFANPARGEAVLVVGGAALVLRPSFEALVAAEGELGSLFALVERAAEGRLGLGEIAALFWHCLGDAPEAVTRERVGAAVVEVGLARTAPVLRAVLTQILQGCPSTGSG